MIIILRCLAEASKNCPIKDFHTGARQTSTGQEGEEVSSQEKLTDPASKQGPQQKKRENRSHGATQDRAVLRGLLRNYCV